MGFYLNKVLATTIIAKLIFTRKKEDVAANVKADIKLQ